MSRTVRTPEGLMKEFYERKNVVDNLTIELNVIKAELVETVKSQGQSDPKNNVTLEAGKFMAKLERRVTLTVDDVKAVELCTKHGVKDCLVTTVDKEKFEAAIVDEKFSSKEVAAVIDEKVVFALKVSARTEG